MTKDMTTGNPVKLLLWFSIPLLVGNIFQQFYNMRTRRSSGGRLATAPWRPSAAQAASCFSCSASSSG